MPRNDTQCHYVNITNNILQDLIFRLLLKVNDSMPTLLLLFITVITYLH